MNGHSLARRIFLHAPLLTKFSTDYPLVISPNYRVIRVWRAGFRTKSKVVGSHKRIAISIGNSGNYRWIISSAVSILLTFFQRKRLVKEKPVIMPLVTESFDLEKYAHVDALMANCQGLFFSNVSLSSIIKGLTASIIDFSNQSTENVLTNVDYDLVNTYIHTRSACFCWVMDALEKFLNTRVATSDSRVWL